MIRLRVLQESSRASLRGRVALVALLAAVMAFGTTAAEAQSQGDGPTRGNYGRGGGGGGGGRAVGAGIAGALIGIGAGLLIESARARAERDEEVEYERPRRRRVVEEYEVEREPRRRREPKPKVVRTAVEPREVKPKRERPATRTAAKPPANTPPANTPPAVPSARPFIPAAVQTADRSFVPGEVLFEAKPAVTDAAIAELARRERLTRISSETFALTGATIYRYRIRGGRSVDDVVAALSADARVAAAQPNHIFTLSQAEPAFASTQYAVEKMRLTEAHATATGDKVAIAVIDSGVDYTHPSLKAAVAEKFDPVGGTFKPHAHGTAIAGLAAGRGDLASPAPAARLLTIRAFAPDQPTKPGQQGTTMHILRGLDWAAARGTKIVNMSFAGPQDARIAEFIAAGARKGVIHVAAAGNAGPASPPLYPAADPNVIAVTATDAGDQLLSVANRGDHLLIAAPGVDVLVAAPGGAYAYMSGTSMSSAEISGLVALMAQAKPDLTAKEARAALAASARDLGKPGPDAEFGAGAADARGALDVLVAPATASVEPTPAVTPVSASAAAPRP